MTTTQETDAVDNLVRMLANSTAFRNRREKYTFEEAFQYIHTPFLDDPEQAKKPYCVVTDETDGKEKLADGTHKTQGTLGLIVADYDLLNADPNASRRDFKQFAQAVIDDLCELSGVDDFLNIVNIRRTDLGTSDPRAVATNDEAQKSFWLARYEVDWSNI